eukprot:Skav216817  [mRNA]  locus=scaffold135:175480:175752:- [translate_table: standard]
MRGVNSSVTVYESPVLHTVDIAAAVIAVWLSRCHERDIDPTFQARAFDLSSAYEQVGPSPMGRRFHTLLCLTLSSGGRDTFIPQHFPSVQ